VINREDILTVYTYSGCQQEKKKLSS